MVCNEMYLVKIRDIVNSILREPVLAFDEELSIDSVDLVRLIIQLEENWHFEFEEMDLNLNNFKTIINISDQVMKYIEG